ncbi:hypothetical protein [Streptomyces sp. NPDC014734]|uniref:hypothetical protein n=1 Tax=Streptomyces sp. NPDC014734 TaxID=3364886 RepID=UPI0036F7BC9E
MIEYENQVEAAVDGNEVVRYSVEPVHSGPRTVPNSFHIKAEGIAPGNVPGISIDKIVPNSLMSSRYGWRNFGIVNYQGSPVPVGDVMTGDGGFGPVGRDGSEVLGEVLSLNHEAGDEVNWEEIRRVWGTDFPSDHKSFMSVYGVGCVSDWPAVVRPGPPQCDESGSMGQETANARFVRDMKREPERSGTVKLPVIAWG